MEHPYQQWNVLCREFEDAKDAEFEARWPVTRRFADIASDGRQNPTVAELQAWEDAFQRLEAAKAKLKEFVDIHT